MRTLILFLFISGTAFGQRTLIKINGTNTFELGGIFVPSSSSKAGFWGAYNGPVRGEIAVLKYTSSFSSGTEFSGRITFPIIKQSETLPINIFGDGAYKRFQNSGFSSNTVYGAAIISHQIKKNGTIISPYGSAGYIRFSGSGDFKWTVGGDIQINKILVGVEHGRVRSSGTTYLRIGFKFGKNVSDSIDDKSTEQKAIPNEGSLNDSSEMKSQERTQTEIINTERAGEKEEILDNQQLKAAAEQQKQAEQKAAEEAEELRRQERLKAEQEALEQQRLANIKLEEERRVQEQRDAAMAAEAERLRKEAEIAAIANRGNFVVQFFASTNGTRKFQELSGYGTIFTETVEGKALHRYLIGYFQTRSDADIVKSQVRNLGYNDAFVKEMK